MAQLAADLPPRSDDAMPAASRPVTHAPSTADMDVAVLCCIGSATVDLHTGRSCRMYGRARRRHLGVHSRCRGSVTAWRVRKLIGGSRVLQELDEVGDVFGLLDTGEGHGRAFHGRPGRGEILREMLFVPDLPVLAECDHCL